MQLQSNLSDKNPYTNLFLIIPALIFALTILRNLLSYQRNFARHTLTILKRPLFETPP